MKKITRLLAILVALLWFADLSANTSTLVPTYFMNEAFTGLTAYPSGWSTGTALYGASAGTTIGSDKLTISAASASGSRGLTVNFPTSGTETLVYVDFDWYITTATLGQKNALGMVLNDDAGNPVLGLYACGNDAKFHCWNMQPDSATFTVGSFTRASGISITETNNRNLDTQLNFAYTTGTLYNVKATIDFTGKIITSLTITKVSDASSINATNLRFINPIASSVSKISLFNTRSSSAGNGSNSNLSTYIDNFKTYKLSEAVTSTVAINYLDPSTNAFKTARIVTDLPVGSIYTAIYSDKATYTDGSFYYVYDATNTTTDNVVVAADGSSVINLKFTKVVATAGIYTWTGSVNANWSDVDANFTTDGSNALTYQNNNAIVFPSTASQKILSLISALNTGGQNIDLTGNGYSISGSGSISGTGALNLNLNSSETATIGIKNNLNGGLVVNGGNAIVTNDLGAASYTLANGAKLTLQTGSNFSKNIVGSGAITIEASSNVFYTHAVTGASTVNIILDNAGSTSSTWSDYWGGSLPGGAQINVSTGLTTAGFGVGDALLTNNKVSLGDGVRLLRWYNQASSSGGTSTIMIGELNGTASSTIEGGMVDAANRILAYEIGALNTDATFTGIIKNYGSVTQAPLNISKKGTGTWTLTGASTYSPGVFNVDAGKVILNGSLTGAGVPVAVATGATLSGTGTLAGATTVNGTLEGKLNFGSSLTLAGITNISGTGFNAGQFDVVNVTGAVSNGGTLNINFTTTEPTGALTIKLINAGSYTGTFSKVNVIPAATNSTSWGYNDATGELTYYPLGTGNQVLHTNVSIYPTLTRGEVQINGENIASIELVNLTGQLVKLFNTTAALNKINLNGLSTGAYFVKVHSVDGSVKVQQVIYHQ